MSDLYDRPVRFEEVDAAGIVFFGRFVFWCHEAMEHLFDRLPGGYVDLITRRRIGFPAVHFQADWKHPFRFGDVARFSTTVARVGSSSVTFHYDVARIRPGAPEVPHAASFDHVCVATALERMEKVALPADCRALLEEHLAPLAGA